MNDASPPRGIVGIGYEGRDAAAFISGLQGSGTRVLVDVRLNAISRKRGFSKRALASALDDAGIGYWHVPELGNPAWNRAGFGGDAAEVRAARERYAGMIDSGPASARLEELAGAAREGIVALMCVEADDRACHRYVILQKLRLRLEEHEKAF